MSRIKQEDETRADMKQHFLQDILDRVANYAQCGTSPKEDVILDSIELRVHRLLALL